MAGPLPVLDDAFIHGSERASSPPSVFYVNLTERCQLRCRHCITRAPERTADGSARDLTADVLAALKPHLAHARYVGLTHAGEPMLSSAFEPLLEAIAEVAPRDRRPIVHLLTNGQAMTEHRFLDVAARGVRSLSLSIDGMSEQSHDALREGSRVATLKERAAAWVRLREEHLLDVRLGAAWTVTSRNLGEVLEGVRFFADVGFDWMKLEEVFPLHDEAARWQPPPDGVRAVVGQALGLARSLGFRLLDHTQGHEVWKCGTPSGVRMTPDAARFAELDDYANRLDINPCRMPWEVVCVEPDGQVKPMSFHHLAAGTVLEHDLLELFDGRPFQGERIGSRQRRLCQAGPVTCPPPRLDPA